MRYLAINWDTAGGYKTHTHQWGTCHLRGHFLQLQQSSYFSFPAWGPHKAAQGTPTRGWYKESQRGGDSVVQQHQKRVLQKKSTGEGGGPVEYKSPLITIVTSVVKICSCCRGSLRLTGMAPRNNSRISLRSKHTSGLVIFLHRCEKQKCHELSTEDLRTPRLMFSHSVTSALELQV